MNARFLKVTLLLVLCLTLQTQPAAAQADSASPPESPVKLIFLHHSTGGNWLADAEGNDIGGNLGRELMQNNYFVSATNYGWQAGDDAIGDRTDIGNWWEWFRGPTSETIMAAVYKESGQNVGDFGSWPRMKDPGGENAIVLFKSCFPNSDLQGSAKAAPPAIDDNPLRGQAAEGNSDFTVANAKGIYIDLLKYFATQPDKLFVVITAPPRADFETDSAYATNARAFNNWLVNEWLKDYPHKNVAVFDYYNVLTSNAGSTEQNDIGAATGNHHRWLDGKVQHLQTVKSNVSAYPSGDSHPNTAGQLKATAEFVPLLNVFYNRWRNAEGD